MYILIAGDSHVPDRAERINPRFRQLIENWSPWEMVFFTGDLTGMEVFNWLRSISKALFIVRGNMDVLTFPQKVILEIKGFKVGMIHGDGIYPRGDTKGLSKAASSLGVDILISGHTHSDFVKTSITGGELLLNPGSLTGVWGGGGGSYTPSFMVLDMGKNKLELHVFKMELGDIRREIYSIERIGGKWLISFVKEVRL
ncbi:MAG: YfcE family phosphodiesterase [Desulfurococcaceae archaeon]